jgi:hypothetical protein
VERITERLAGLLGQCEEAAKAANEAREGDTVRQTADWGAKMQEWDKDRERYVCSRLALGSDDDARSRSCSL